MEFRDRKKRRVAGTSEYPTRLQLYKTPPVQTIPLKEFEELARKRLELLQKLDRVRQQCSHEGIHKNSDDYRRKMDAVIKHMPLTSVDDKGLQTRHIEERRRDHISHYILRLAYCRTEEMRRWFLNQETELLRCRFLYLMKKEDIEEFFLFYKGDFKFDLEIIPHPQNAKGEYLQLAEDSYSFYNKLFKTELGEDDTLTTTLTCYKVPFTGALDLVQSRQVVVNRGFVYVPTSSNDMIVSLVCNKFRARVSEELVKTLHHLAVVDDDERLAPFLRGLKNSYLGEDFTSAGTQFAGQIQLSQINTLSRESYPPCMRHLHESLRKEHHLKHAGRLQYGLFLKSIGLTLNQALSFWRSEFTKRMEPDKFEKQYAYNVRHNYGKEGKRANYTAYSCMKIILSNAPSQGDHHGCPFRHWDEDHLRHMLSSHGVSHKGIEQVMEYAKNSHYQLACQKYFEIIHGLATAPFSLEHPTQFFLESRKARGSDAVKLEGENLGKTPGSGDIVKQEDAASSQMVDGEFGDISAQDLEAFENDMDIS